MLLPKSNAVKLSAFHRLVILLHRDYSTSQLTGHSSVSTIMEVRERMQRRKEEEERRRKQPNPEKELLGQVDSIASIMLLKQNASKYPSFARKSAEIHHQMHQAKESTKAIQKISFPLAAEERTEIFQKPKSETENELSHDGKKIVPDSGYFVRGDHLYDEYEPSSAIELPESEMNELPFTFHGYDNDPVEEVPLVFPGQRMRSMKDNPKPDWRDVKARKKAKEEARRTDKENLGEIVTQKDKYIVEDPSIPPSTRANCAGCGALFQCNNSSLPGFVPVSLFEEVELNARKKRERQRADYMCRRCFLQKEYNFLLNVNICPVDYQAIMGHLKLMQEALIILVVDMADLECSIHQDLPKIIGEHKPMIVVGNKIDLLPPDAQPGYLKRYHDALRQAVYKSGFSTRFNILNYSLVSAKTGYGVEDLITKIYSRWVGPRNNLRSNIYLIGCTNAGKSTLFNTFLQSDLCMVRAMDLVERVTTSIWPGTTMSLLKFPMWNPTEKCLSEELYEATKDPKHLVLQGYVGNTFKDTEDESQPVSVEQVRQEFYGEADPVDGMEDGVMERRSRLNLNDPVFQSGTNWCHDTPGTINEQQVLNVFTLEELINVIPRQLMIPRTFIVRAGQSLLLGGVGRVDLISAERNNRQSEFVWLSVLASKRLKVECMATRLVDEYMKRNLGNPDLGAPIGGAERLAMFPKLEAKTFDIVMEERSKVKASTDIVLSSIGWVAVTSLADYIRLAAWTPSGRGLQMRSPPIMPYAAELRGPRISGTYAYKTRLNSNVEDSIYTRGDRAKKYERESSYHDGADEDVCFDFGI